MKASRVFRLAEKRLPMLFLVAGFSANGWAQGPEAPDRPDRRASAIEEVIVTARRVEESLQDTPISVAAFSQSDLEQLGATEVGDIARYTPNLEMRKLPGSQDNYSFAIRGISSAESALAIDPTVGVYVDGVYIARSTGLAFDIVDMQRIEVLRGPQGTLFGRNTIGGAINVVSQKPQGALALKQQLGAGNRGRQRVQTTLDTPRVGGVAAKLAYLSTSRDGLVASSIDGRDIGQAEAQAARLALNWETSDTFSLDYSYDWSRRESQPNLHQISKVRDVYADPDARFYGGQYHESAEAGSSSERLGKLPINSTEDDESNSDIDGHALTVEWDLDAALTFKSLTSYRDWSSDADNTDFGSFPSPADGSLCSSPNPDDYAFLIGECINPVPAGTLVPIFGASRSSEQQQWTQEFQFIGSALQDRLRYTAGLYYFEEQAEEVNPQQLVLPAALIFSGVNPALGPINRGNSLVIELPHFRYSTDNKAYAAYADFTYTPLPRLDVTLGFRYTVDEKEIELTNTLDRDGDNPAGVLKTVTDSNRWNNFNPALTLNYRWSEELSTYGKVVTGYRSGGYNVRVFTSSGLKTPFNEEEVVSYEIGWKSDLLDRRLRFNGALFFTEYSDQQVAAFEAGAGGASTNIVNAGESVNSGLELEAIWLPFAGMKISASYSFLDVDIKEFITGRLDPDTAFATNPGVNEDISDTASTDRYAPDNSGALAVEYQLAPWRWGQLMLRADLSYTDRITFHPQLNKFDSSDAHTLLGARATLADIPAGRDGNLRLSLWGKNLTNEEYREFGIDFGIVGFAMNTYGELRSYGLDIVYEFNR